MEKIVWVLASISMISLTAAANGKSVQNLALSARLEIIPHTRSREDKANESHEKLE